MPSAPRQILSAQAPSAQLAQIFCPHVRKFVQELTERFRFAFLQMPPPAERFKRHAFAALPDDSCARHPIGTLRVNQMADHIERAGVRLRSTMVFCSVLSINPLTS
jgi:hypothetical protein